MPFINGVEIVSAPETRGCYGCIGRAHAEVCWKLPLGCYDPGIIWRTTQKPRLKKVTPNVWNCRAIGIPAVGEGLTAKIAWAEWARALIQ